MGNIDSSGVRRIGSSRALNMESSPVEGNLNLALKIDSDGLSIKD